MPKQGTEQIVTTSTAYEGPHYFDPSDPRASSPTLAVMMSTYHRREACFGVGPLEVCATYRDLGIDFEIKLLGQRIGSGRLDQNNANASVGVDLGVAKASVGLAADFNARELRITGEVCVRDWLGRWRCTSFNDVLLRW